ncbi:MAG TPA: ABC transporter ATP-binding protein/permease [Pseudonocardia sp.]|nr:ABC transporter ATP-binding protein/permease [Pseudonocardia sp.]
MSVAACVLFTLVAAILMRVTAWGRNFRQLTVRYFIPGTSWASWLPAVTVAAMITISIVGVRLQVLDSFFQNGLYTAFQDRNQSEFYTALRVFAAIAGVNIVQVGAQYYLSNLLIIRWRVWLNDQMVTDWLRDKAYHTSRFLDDRVDNPDQRIQEDIDTFTTDSQTLLLGAVSAIISTCSFTILLWQLSGPISVFGAEIPRAMTFAIFLYVIAASLVVFKIGRPLIMLNFVKEALTASFRYSLVRLRDNSEEVALFSGEKAERRTLDARFRAVIGNAWDLVHRNLRYTCANFVATQLSVIVPFVLQAPRFFSGAVTLGGLQQTAVAMGQVHDALSFFKDNYDSFAAYRATIQRLAGLKNVNERARELPTLTVTEDNDTLTARELTVSVPAGRPLISELNLSLTPGDRLLITGTSGTGKTTLLRSLAGLWPYAHGQVGRPTGPHTLFLSQRPYLPLGDLRQALHYPGDHEDLRDGDAPDILRRVQLSHLVAQLDESVDWSQVLSPGEQQRLGFARILARRPRLVFLDEATSALDPGIERMLYDLLFEELPDSIVVSVGHHESLEALHTSRLTLLGSGAWTLTSRSSLSG